jgi:hypothetical protein
MSAADHVEALLFHSGGKLLFPRVVLNNAVPSDELLQKYESQDAHLVINDRPRLESMGLECSEHSLLARDQVIRHDPDLLAQAVYRGLGV